MASSSVFFYVSGHGFGHTVRQAEIIGTLLRAVPNPPRVIVRTSAPGWLFRRSIVDPFELRPGETDTGVVQIDGLRLAEGETIRRAQAFHRGLPRWIETEAAALRDAGAALVVSDAPAGACAAAAHAGVPSVVCANFTWDWIYSAYAGFAPGVAELIGDIQRCYRHADEAWRLPLHGGFQSFDRIVDMPMVARHSRADVTADDIRAVLGLPGGRRLALVSFGGYGVSELPLSRVDCTDGWEVVVTAPGPHLSALPRGVHGVAEDRLYASGLQYADLVRAVDVVVSKPGYGIISDCVANETALLYTSRGRFIEYDVMVAEMPRFLRCRFLEMDDFLNGTWREALDALAAQPDPPERMRTDGAAVVTANILERLGM